LELALTPLTVKLALLMDYQNVHLTARDRFAPPGTHPVKTQLHPARFAGQVVATRNARHHGPHAQLVLVRVYRGVPNSRLEPRLNSVTEAQRSEWIRDPRVEVWYRPLRYPPSWPADPAREKGVDVKLAVDLIRLADSGLVDVVVVASHDTDLEPALELAGSHGRTRIETAGWFGANRLRVPGRAMWHTALDGTGFADSVDPRRY
jgi:hypothetical protein